MFQDNNPIYEFRGPWGIPVQIGASLVLLPLIFLSTTTGLRDLYFDMIFVALVIASILAHELGHAWGNLIQGVRVRRIMLHGGGGFCERATSATRYQSELIVAMGPIVNLTIWALCSMIAPEVPRDTFSWIIASLAWINLWLALFNLIPVHPLDGGKLFELVMCRIARPSLARKISGGVGLGISIVWIPLMLLSYFTFGFVLFFFPSVQYNWRLARGQA